MDGSPDPKATPAAPTPYRAGKALTDIIAPDRRREKMAAIVALSMIAGVALWVLGGRLIESVRAVGTTLPAPTVATMAGRIAPSLLRGPRTKVVMPPAARTIMHVWLQGCSDCMPAFKAMSEVQAGGGFGVDAPIVNVAYGEADESWARTFGVSDNLVFDPDGANVVKPLGISSFTTLVVETDGRVLHSDRPDRTGYVTRVRNAVLYGDANGEPAPLPPATVDPPPAGETLDAAAVQRVVAAHGADVKAACWERRATAAPRSASVTLTLTIGPDGRVAQVSSSGDDPSMASCIASRAKSWVFPAGGSSTTVSIPFQFVQQ